MKLTPVLFSKKYSPLFQMLIQTLLIFLVIILPLSINITSEPPPYSINNTHPGGMSYFNSLLLESGYNTTRTILSTDPIIKLPESSTLIIAGGSKNYRDSEILAIDGFILRGGLVVILAGSGPTNILAQRLGVFLSSSTILETIYYYKTPEIIMLNSPIETNTSLCMIEARELSYVVENSIQTELFGIHTYNTAFLDENQDRIWDIDSENTESLQVGTVLRRGLGVVVVISSPSFLTNDLYSQGFGNINLALYLIGYYSSGEESLVCFEESHKRWPFSTTEGMINQSYGTIILLSKTQLFIFLLVLIVLILYYVTPRFRERFKPKETYKKFLSDRIWSRERELYDTFGTPIKPTIEEQFLSNLYFQYELYPQKAYHYYLTKKVSYIQLEKFTDEEKELFEIAFTRKLDQQTFLSLFRMLEEIQKRGRFK